MSMAGVMMDTSEPPTPSTSGYSPSVQEHVLHTKVSLHTLRQNTIQFDSLFSPCGRYLIICNNFGRVVVWNISLALSESIPIRERGRRPCVVVDVCDEAIYALHFTRTPDMGDVLVCGTNTLIHALRWDALLDLAQQHHSQVHVNKAPNTEKDVSTHKERETPPHTAGQTAHTDTGTCVRSHACAYPVLEEVLAFSLRSPSHFMYIGGVETNALASSEGVLYAACGDSCVHAWSLETRNFLHSFEGHDDYVQCISVRQNGEIISGAEDGVVKFWDSNSQECLNTLSPETMSLKQKKSGTSQAPSQKAGSGASAPSKKTRGRKAKTAAKSEDKVQETLTFIPCLEIDQTDNWLATGGINGPTLWHIPSQLLASRPKTVKLEVVRDLAFFEDEILCVGSTNLLCRYTLAGELKADAGLSMPSAYSISINRNGLKILAVCGVGNTIDIFVNFGVAAFSLIFY